MEAPSRTKRNVSVKHLYSNSEDSNEYSDNEACNYGRKSNYTRRRKRRNSNEISKTSSKRSKIENGGRISTSSDGDNLKEIKKRDYVTRRPESFNRGAVMARENRLKKKQYVADLEGQVDYYKNENKQLTRLLKRESNLVQELKNERQYLKSVIENSKEIGTLLKKFRGVINGDDETNERPSPQLPKKVPVARKTACSFANYIKDEPDTSFESAIVDGLMTYDSSSPLLSDTIKDDFFENDFNNLGINFPTPQSLSSEDLFLNEFSLLDVPQLISPLSPEDYGLTESSSGEPYHVEEHNYTTKAHNETAGVCFHVVGGKVSLEFCSKCHLSAKTDYLNPENTESSESEDY